MILIMKKSYFLPVLIILVLAISRCQTPSRIVSPLTVSDEHQIGLILTGELEYLDSLSRVGKIFRQNLTDRGYRITILKPVGLDEVFRSDFFNKVNAGGQYDHFFVLKMVSLNITEKRLRKAETRSENKKPGRPVKSIEKKCEVVVELDIYGGHTGLLLWRNRASGLARGLDEHPYSGTKQLDNLIEALLKDPRRFETIIQESMAQASKVIIDKFVAQDIELDPNQSVTVYFNVYEKEATPINLLPGAQIQIIDQTIDQRGQPVKRNQAARSLIPTTIITENTGSYDLELPEGYYKFVVTKDKASVELFALVIGDVRNINLVLP